MENSTYLRIWAVALGLALLMGLLRCSGGKPGGDQGGKDTLAEPPHKVAQISWRDLSYIDTVGVGDTVVRDYVFYNTGWKPVVVKHAIPNRPECTCRVPSREVPIGEQDTIRLTCVFAQPEERAGVEIIVEHNTPQPFPTLLFIGTIR